MMGDSQDNVIAVGGRTCGAAIDGVADTSGTATLSCSTPLNKAHSAVTTSQGLKLVKKNRRTLVRSSACYTSAYDETGRKSAAFTETRSLENTRSIDKELDNGGKSALPIGTRKRRTLKPSGASGQSNHSIDVGSEVGRSLAPPLSPQRSPCSTPHSPMQTPNSPTTNSPPRILFFGSSNGPEAKTRATVHVGTEHSKKKMLRKGATISTTLIQKLKFADTGGSGLGQQFRNGTTDQLDSTRSPSAVQASAGTSAAAEEAVDEPQSIANHHSCSRANTSTSNWKSAFGKVRASKKCKKREGHRFVSSPMNRNRKSSHAQAKPTFGTGGSQFISSSSLSPLRKSTRPASVPILPLASITHEVSSSEGEGEQDSKTKNYNEAESASSSESGTEDEEEDDRAYVRTCSAPPEGKTSQGGTPGSCKGGESPNFALSKSMPSTSAYSSDGCRVVGASRRSVGSGGSLTASSRLRSDSDEQERRNLDALEERGGEVVSQIRSQDESGTSTEAEDSESSYGESGESEEDVSEEEQQEMQELGDPEVVFPNEYCVEYKPHSFARWAPAVVRHYDKGYYILDVHPHVHHSRVRKMQDPLKSMSHTSKDPRRQMAAKGIETVTTTPKVATAKTAASKSKASRFASFVAAPYYAMRRYWCSPKSRKPKEPSRAVPPSSEASDKGQSKSRWFSWKSRKLAEPRHGLLDY